MSFDLGRKIPYDSHKTKLFHVSEDEWSRERIRALKEAADIFVRTLPFEVGIGLYGSLAKGKTLTEGTVEYSDVDIQIFLEESGIQVNLSALQQSAFFRKWYEHYSETNSCRMSVIGLVKQYVTEIVQSQFSKTAKQAGFPSNQPVPVEIKIWDHLVSASDLEWMTAVVDYIHAVEEAERAHQRKPDPPELLGPDFYVDDDVEGEYRKLMWQFRGLFGLQVGGGLRHFQRIFFQSFQSIPDAATRQHIWEHLRQALLAEHKQFLADGRRAHQLPVRLEDALELYGVELPMPVDDALFFERDVPTPRRLSRNYGHSK